MIARNVRTLVALGGLLVAAAPAFAQRGYPEREGSFRARLGAFAPQGDSEYWDDSENLFTGDASDLESASFGLDYLLPLNRHLSLAFAGSIFSGETTQSYLDFEDNFGDRIRHDTTLDIASATVGLVFHFTGPEAVISPYIGVGGGAYPWNLQESGDFIASNNDIFSATLESEGVAFGYYGVVGLEAPITRRVSLFAEGRWTQAEDELSDDLEGLGDIDLSGREFAAGISWNL